MLVLPIVNKNRVMNVRVKLKNAHKVRRGVSFSDAEKSDIIINRKKFSESSYKHSKDKTAAIDFIRSKTIQYPRDFLVTTEEGISSTLYDVYQVSPPPAKVNDSLDKLYDKAITDLRKEIPNTIKRGRYVSFEELGFNEYLTEDKIAKLQKVVRETDEEEWPMAFQKEGIADLRDTISFINNFECTVISDTTIPEDSLQTTLKALSVLNSRDYKNLNKYYRTAKSNADIYTKMSYINKIIYDKPLSLIQSEKQKTKELVKEREYN